MRLRRRPHRDEAGGTKVSIRAPGAALAPTILQRIRCRRVAAQRLEHPSTGRQPIVRSREPRIPVKSGQLPRHERRRVARANALSRRSATSPPALPVKLIARNVELIDWLFRPDRTAVYTALLAMAGSAAVKVYRGPCSHGSVRLRARPKPRTRSKPRRASRPPARKPSPRRRSEVCRANGAADVRSYSPPRHVTA